MTASGSSIQVRPYLQKESYIDTISSEHSLEWSMHLRIPVIAANVFEYVEQNHTVYTACDCTNDLIRKGRKQN